MYSKRQFNLLVITGGIDLSAGRSPAQSGQDSQALFQIVCVSHLL